MSPLGLRRLFNYWRHSGQKSKGVFSITKFVFFSMRFFLYVIPYNHLIIHDGQWGIFADTEYI